jgi:hypothetical protein
LVWFVYIVLDLTVFGLVCLHCITLDSIWFGLSTLYYT